MGKKERYKVLTKSGERSMTLTEILDLSYSIATTILTKNYKGYRSSWEDLKQEIAVSVWKALPRYKPNGKIENYIWSIATGTLNHEMRRVRKQESRLTQLTDEMALKLRATSSDECREDDHRKTELDEFVKTLTRQERKAVEMKRNGASNVEIYNALYKPKPYKKNIGASMVYFWRNIGNKYNQWRNKRDAK